MGGSNTRPLLFLGTCLAFAETVLGILAGLADANATIVAGFAIAALGLVLLTLVFMYWRDPAFLTLSGEQVLDLRKLQEVVSKLPPDLIQDYLESLTDADIQRGQPARMAEAVDATAEDAEEIDREFQDIIRLMRDFPSEGDDQ